MDIAIKLIACTWYVILRTLKKTMYELILEILSVLVVYETVNVKALCNQLPLTVQTLPTTC
jgi:hypothetical protein